MGEFFENRYYNINRQFLMLTGLWPGQKLLHKLLKRSFVFAYIVSFYVISITVYLTSSHDLNTLAELTANSSLCFITAQKYLYYCFNGAKMKVLMETMQRNWALLSSEKEYSIMHATSNEGRLYTLYYIYFSYVVISFFALLPFAPILLDLLIPLNETRPRRYPYTSEYVVDGQNYFYLVALHLSMGGVLAATVLLATDTMILVCVQHVCGIFRIAGYKFLHAFDVDIKNPDTSTKRIDYQSRIIEGVKYHKRAIQFTADIAECYQWTTFVAITLGVITVTFHIFCVVLFTGRWEDMTQFIVCSIGEVLYEVMYIYAGQSLIDRSTAILRKAYNSAWYTAPVSERQLLLLVMQRSLTPSVLLLGKLIPVSFESFASLLRATVSYVAVLNTMK